MAEERIPVVEDAKIRHVGVIDLGDFYRDIKRWLDFYNYTDFSEESYEEKINTGENKNIEIHWVAKNEKSDYITYEIRVFFLLVAVSDVKINVEGKEIKQQKGDFEMHISASLIKNVKEHGSLRKIYENFIIAKRLDEYAGEIYEHLYSLQEWIKEYFNQYVK